MRYSMVIAAALACVVMACGPSGGGDQSGASAIRPDQSRFMATKSEAESDYDGAVNDIQRQQAKAAWEKLVCTSVASPRFVRWSGTVKSIMAGGALGGPGVIIDVGNGISLDASLDEGSPVYKAVSALTEGSSVTVSGSFVPGDDGCIVDLIGVPWGDSRIKKPDFDIKLESVDSP